MATDRDSSRARLRAALPQPTELVFLVFALVVWLNAALNRYRFNVALALIASVPLLILLVRGVFLARHETVDD